MRLRLPPPLSPTGLSGGTPPTKIQIPWRLSQHPPLASPHFNNAASSTSVSQHSCGFVLPFENLDAWLAALRRCCEIYNSPLQSKDGDVSPSSEYAEMRKLAAERSKDFTLEKMTSAQWEFFRNLLSET